MIDQASILAMRESFDRDYPQLGISNDELRFLEPIDQGALSRESVRSRIGTHRANMLESLVGEAVTLLGRCMEARSAKRELEESLVRWWLSHKREKRKVAVARERHQNGASTLTHRADKLASAARVEIDAALQDLIRLHRRSLDMRAEDDPSMQERIQSSKDYTAVLSDRNREATDPAAARREQAVAVYEAASLEQSIKGVEIQTLLNKLSADLAELRTPVSQAEEEARNEEISADEQFLEHWQTVTTRTGLALNFIQRIAEQQRLFDRDFGNAYGRCIAIEEGARQVGASVEALPSDSPDDVSILTEVVLWIRDVSELLTLREHNTVRSDLAIQIPLQGSESEFRIDESMVSSALRPRVVGLRVSAVGLPESEFGSVEIEFDDDSQSHRFFVGDVCKYDTERTTGIVRTDVLQNKSPIGTWRFKVDNRFSQKIGSDGYLILQLTLDQSHD